jgi:hypothetical protein
VKTTTILRARNEVYSNGWKFKKHARSHPVGRKRTQCLNQNEARVRTRSYNVFKQQRFDEFRRRQEGSPCMFYMPKTNKMVSRSAPELFGMAQTPAALRVRPYPFGIRIRQPESPSRRVSELENELKEHRDMCEGRFELNLSSCIPDHTNEAPFPVSTGYPSVFFLDVNVFKRRRLKAPMPQWPSKTTSSKR